MREQRWKRLRTGLLIIAFSAIGMLEYVQLVQAFDLPQMMLVVPVVSVIAMLLLGKYSFFCAGLHDCTCECISDFGGK